MNMLVGVALLIGLVWILVGWMYFLFKWVTKVRDGGTPKKTQYAAYAYFVAVAALLSTFLDKNANYNFHSATPALGTTLFVIAFSAAIASLGILIFMRNR